MSHEALIHAFPKRLEQDVKTVISILRKYTGNASISGYGPLVFINGESLKIPYRVYCDQTIIWSDTGYEPMDNQQLILECIYTRHHNGYVREKKLQLLIDNDEDWIIPFKIQLSGEYVLEIIELLNENINEGNIPLYKKFIAENEEYWSKTRDRIISYWSTYYRWRFPERHNYPGFQIIRKLDPNRTYSY